MAGALLLLVTPAKAFSGIVPWLLLFSTVLLAAGPTIARAPLPPHTGVLEWPGGANLACWQHLSTVAIS